MPGRQRCIVEAEALHHPGAEVFDQHIGRTRQPREHLAPGRLRQVEDDAALAAVERREGRAVAALGPGHAARGVAIGRFHFDDARAHVGEYHRAVGPGHHLGHIEHNNVVK